MPRTVVLATRNRHKVAELQRILAETSIATRVSLRTMDEFGLADPAETGATFADNALLKARTALAATGLAAIADDSGLVVDALGGQPGVRSARYAGTHGDDAANLELVLARMAGRADRGARFVCAAALVAPEGEWVTEGTLEGRLTEAPRGEGGFGYDPILVPDGDARTCAELDPAEKDAISHRGQAFRRLAPLLAEIAGSG